MTLRRLTSWILASCALLAAGSTAWAMPPSMRPEIERALEPPTPPGPGLERAQLRSIPWCSGVRERDRDWALRVPDDLRQYRTSRHYEIRLFRLASGVCSEPEEPLAQRVATEVLQLWINETGMAARDAVESLALRVDKDGFQAERTALCDAIKPRGDDTRKERNALATARFKLFGCRRDDPMWMQADEVEHLGPFVDRGPVTRDELAHLAWVLHRQFKELEQGNDNALAGYAIDQFDFHAVSADRAIHQLDAEPFRGSRYARVMVLESLGRAQMITARIEALVAKRVSDPEWKELLITAPDRGAAAWNAAAERDKAVLARSDEFDRKLREGGDTHGCQTALRADFLAILKTFKREDLPGLEAAMSDHPLAGLLARRLARCMMTDGDEKTRFAGALLDHEVASNVRVIPGPRTAAYHAALAAHAAHRDRDEGEDEDGSRRSRSRPQRETRRVESRVSFDDMTRPLQGVLQLEYQAGNSMTDNYVAGVIKSVSKGKRGVHVVFVKKKKMERGEVCRETNKIDRQDPRTGKITYRKVCHWTDPKPVDEGPDPVDVPVELAGGLQAGRYATFSGIPINGVMHLSDSTPRIPLEVYRGVQKAKDEDEGESGKHLVALYGLVLE